MTVIARWTIAYKNVSYNGGEKFELDERDYEKFKNDVMVVKDTNPSLSRKKTKGVTVKKTK